MSTLATIQAAGQAGQLLPATVANLTAWLGVALPKWATDSIDELVSKQAWGELNDRFYRDMAFGTGGMRGRTIGVVTATAETGTLNAQGTPEHAAIGSNILNDFTLTRATIGLFRYTQKHLAATGRAATAPKLVIAHDVRHFSRHFCELSASIWTQLGGEALIFDGPRSTPQLSFSVRKFAAHAGVVITASHNPPHDNGFKAYFEDGAQVVPPHDEGIVAEVNAVALSELGSYLNKNISQVTVLGRDADDAYLAVAAQAVIDRDVFKKADAAGKPLRVVFTNIHGTGAVASLPLLKAAGCDVRPVPEQLAPDGRFPTVKSPNPENAEALAMAVALAEKDGLDLVLATDPDADRVGCAVRGKDGRMHLLTGNQVGALLTEYRLTKYKELGWIPQNGSDRVAVIKTFVTTSMQDTIGRRHGVKVINTLTGFKWIAAKIRRYEEQLKAALANSAPPPPPGPFDYDATPFTERARLLQEHATFYAFGCEESYGYLANDSVRDKDANSAALMVAELAAALKLQGLTVPEYLDRLYLKYGFFLEGVINIYYEGASGAAKIKRILDTYRSSPPKAFGDVAVTQFQDFGREQIKDADGELIPQQDLYIVSLANGYSFAARGSGTEPKMKFYVFASAKVSDAAALEGVKAQVKAELDRVKALIEADAKQRAE
ncbi:phospho-sugar mutase [Geminisphaera colitermitum]|uniref:phospho-sugar mutase n=1 Tax=Geminisphaera colitermitum TaxID=1148786 RepID=UPI000158CD1E|nr:phospho-sugar mutase [Geminisphaera colitermitum]